MNGKVMTFGKYKGRTVESVITSDPDYALWAHKKVASFKLTVPEIQDCVSRSVAGARGILPKGHWDDGADDCDEYGGLSYGDFGNN